MHASCASNCFRNAIALFCLSIGLSLAVNSVVLAQSADPVAPMEWTQEYTVSPWSAGISAGAALPLAIGDGSPLCDACDFASSTEMRGNGGLLAAYRLDERWTFTANIAWAESHATYTWDTPGMLRDNSFVQELGVMYEFSSMVEMSSVSAQLSARWYSALGGLYLLAGPQLDFVYANNELQTQLRVNQTYPELNSGPVTVHDGPVGDVLAFQKAQLSLRAGIGYEFALGRNFSISPEAGIAMPLTSLSPDHDGWKLGAVQTAVALAWRW